MRTDSQAITNGTTRRWAKWLIVTVERIARFFRDLAQRTARQA